jgi:hypothetical protein
MGPEWEKKVDDDNLTFGWVEATRPSQSQHTLPAETPLRPMIVVEGRIEWHS